MEEMCGDMEFSLYGREEYALEEDVENFKYMERPLDQTNDDWTSVLRNVK